MERRQFAERESEGREPLAGRLRLPVAARETGANRAALRVVVQETTEGDQAVRSSRTSPLSAHR